jgi:hypothetical protein
LSDLKERFALVDEVDPRDLWSEARRRAAAPAAPRRAIEWPPGAGRRLAATGVALAVFATAAVFSWRLSHPEDAPLPHPRPAEVPVDMATELGPGWSELPPPPEVRSAPATGWTGSELLVWGGYVFDGSGDKTPRGDGFAFDAASRTWSELPASPLDPRARAASAWTGSELLVWGGWDGGTSVFGDGAAYDPRARTWRLLPASPIGARAPLSVWTGEELIVWGTAIRFPSAAMEGAAYDPDTDTWRTIHDAPIRLTDATANWTGEEMIVFGAALDGNNHADTPTAIGAAYDPDADAWRELPPSDLSPQANTAAWPSSGELVAWDYDHATAAYQPSADTWRELPRVPLEFAECAPESAAIPGYVFGNYCGELTLYAVSDDAWRDVTRGDLRGWVIEPIAAGDAFLVTAHSLELSATPGVTFDQRMLGYVPRAEAAASGSSADPFVPGETTSGGDTRLPLVWPDGTTAVLVLPSDLLDGVDVHPSVSYLLTAYRPPRFSVLFLHGPAGVEREHLLGTEPLRIVQDATGADVELWDAMPSPHVDERGERLVFRTRAWSVIVSVAQALTAEEVAASMSVEERSGYPVVHTEGPIALSDEFGEGDGPVISLSWPGFPDRFVEVAPEGCAGFADEVGSEYGATCLAGDALFLDVYGDRHFVTTVIERARIEDFVPA